MNQASVVDRHATHARVDTVQPSSLSPEAQRLQPEQVFVDLFAGCGGLSLGLLNSGWDGLFALEKHPHAFATLRHNLIDTGSHNAHVNRFDWPSWLPTTTHDVKTFIQEYRSQLEAIRGAVQLVAGGPPCQGFSFAGKRNRQDPRNALFQYHVTIASLLMPQLVLLENVRGIAAPFKKRPRNGSSRAPTNLCYADEIEDALEDIGYQVEHHAISATHFGVPQARSRHFIVGIRTDLLNSRDPISFAEILDQLRIPFLKSLKLPPTSPVTAMEAVSDLETNGRTLEDCTDSESPRGFKQIIYRGPETPYQRLMRRHSNGHAPDSSRLINHRPETTERFQAILRSCRKGVGLSPSDRIRLGLRKHAMVPLDPNKPAHTVTTLPDDLLHYTEPRAHTVREHARFQSFPDWFRFRGPFTTGGRQRASACPRYTQVGNAVPPLLAEAIGQALSGLLNKLLPIPEDALEANRLEERYT